MWKVVIVRSTKREIVGYELDHHFTFTVSAEKLKSGVKLKKGDVVEGYRAGGTFYATNVLE